MFYRTCVISIEYIKLKYNFTVDIALNFNFILFKGLYYTSFFSFFTLILQPQSKFDGVLSCNF